MVSERKFNEILLEILNDRDLKVVFEGNPRGFLRQRGVTVPDEIELRVHEDTARLRHIVIPYLEGEPPATVEELEERLSRSVSFG
ncbi:MAG: nitrile hydratase subunit alpha [Thermoanaerobaculaceae bacterium]|jgi:hypothetical protein|nr:nitrile hydratase subunit alpha [Thermoanaerobaculaceae bacterium]